MRNILHKGTETLSIGEKNYEIPINVGYKLVGEVISVASGEVTFKSVWDESGSPKEFTATAFGIGAGLSSSIEIEVGSYAVFYHDSGNDFFVFAPASINKNGASAIFYLEDELDFQLTNLSSNDEFLCIKDMVTPALTNFKLVTDYKIIGEEPFILVVSTDNKKVIVDAASFSLNLISEKEDCEGTETGGGYMVLSSVGGKIKLSGESEEDVFCITGAGDLSFSAACCDSIPAGITSVVARGYSEIGVLQFEHGFNLADPHIIVPTGPSSHKEVFTLATTHLGSPVEIAYFPSTDKIQYRATGGQFAFSSSGKPDFGIATYTGVPPFSSVNFKFRNSRTVIVSEE